MDSAVGAKSDNNNLIWRPARPWRSSVKRALARCRVQLQRSARIQKEKEAAAEGLRDGSSGSRSQGRRRCRRGEAQSGNAAAAQAQRQADEAAAAAQREADEAAGKPNRSVDARSPCPQEAARKQAEAQKAAAEKEKQELRVAASAAVRSALSTTDTDRGSGGQHGRCSLCHWKSRPQYGREDCAAKLSGIVLELSISLAGDRRTHGLYRHRGFQYEAIAGAGGLSPRLPRDSRIGFKHSVGARIRNG